jgi:hypothetical protein
MIIILDVCGVGPDERALPGWNQETGKEVCAIVRGCVYFCEAEFPERYDEISNR